jgi:hypothetical protein
MIDTDEYERTTPELEEFEGKTLGDTLTNLITEIIQLREENEMLHSRCMHLEGLLEEWRDTE